MRLVNGVREGGRRAGLCPAIIALILALQWHSASAQKPSIEYQVKSSSIYNFLYFVGWPETALGENKSLQICILGRDQFGKAMDVLEGEVVKGQTLHIKKMQTYDRNEASSCHILFISDSLTDSVGQVLNDLRGQSVLTIGETRGFLQKGGMINFLVDENHLRFEVDPENLKKARLTVSDQLLRLSR